MKRHKWESKAAKTPITGTSLEGRQTMTWAEWDLEIASMTVEQAEEHLNAIETLAKWPAFKEEFDWTGFYALRHALQYRITII